MTLACSEPAAGSSRETTLPAGPHPIWLITGVGFVAAAAVFGLVVWRLPAPVHHLPFLPLAALFAVAEIAVVRLEAGPHEYTYSPVEVPVVIGLLTLDGRFLVAAWMLGAVVALGGVHRQAPVRLAYNLACFAVESVTAALVFRSLAGGTDLVSPRVLAAALIAAMVASLISVASVVVAVHLTQGVQPAQAQVRYAGFGLASASVTAALTLVGVVLYDKDPQTLWLLAPPVAGALAVQRAFTVQVRNRRPTTSESGPVDDADLASGPEEDAAGRGDHDPLTGLVDRTRLMEHLSRLLTEPGFTGVACLLVELDDLAELGQRYGPATRDQLLVVTAQRLAGCLREGDLAARLGPDQLAVIAHVSPDDSTREATALAQRIAGSVGRAASLGEHTVTVTTGMGLALRREGDTAEQLMAAAQAALAGARRAGKGRMELFDSAGAVTG